MIMNSHNWTEHPTLEDLKDLDGWVYKTVFNFH